MMRREVIRWFVSMTCFALAVSCAPGCQRVVLYEVRGTIKSAIDGEPIAGVDLEVLWDRAGTALSPQMHLALPMALISQERMDRFLCGSSTGKISGEFGLCGRLS